MIKIAFSAMPFKFPPRTILTHSVRDAIFSRKTLLTQFVNVSLMTSMIVGICGSPRKGATEFVLTEALTMLKEKGFETQLFTVRGKKIGFCTHCDYCLKNKVCNVKDDMFTVYELLGKANGIILATPVYNGGISAQLKTVMDRCRAVLAADKDFFRGKIGMGIAVGGDRVGGQEMVLMQIHTFFILNGAIPVSGGFFGANLGATFWSRDTLKDAKQDEEGFRTLKKTVKRFAEFINKYGSLQAKV